ncbi:endoribonuclease L-PSP, putative [Thiovulum sp. ES]|nr:endoribonuclease L-PSP, putative [Thiovulum sp. ES]
MNFVSTKEAPQAIGPYSQAVQVGNMIFTSGQIALTPEGKFPFDTVEEQTEQVLTNLSKVLEASGSSLNDVIKTTIFLANMEDFSVINGIYEKYFGEHKPARSTVAVKELPKSALIEIEAIAQLR